MEVIAVELEQHVRRAEELGRSVLGTTSPNPPVGAVVLDADGQVVAQGATQPPGGPHAEVVALRAATRQPHTVVTTLEPCRHTGRTGPCTEALLAAGVRRVVFACADPTEVAGGGAGLLRAAGVEVLGGVLADEVGHGALEGWLHRQRTGRPFVTWKVAATLDGRAAAADGTSRWITGEAARADVHALRGHSDAVVVGVGTVLADDPQLTVRPDPGHQPLRVVVDPGGKADPHARVFDAQAPTWWVRDTELPVDGQGRTDLPALLDGLDRRGVVTVLLEGGPTLAGAFVAAGLVDRVVAYVAPVLLGAGPAALGPAGITTLAEASRWRLCEVARFDDDVRLTLRRR